MSEASLACILQGRGNMSCDHIAHPDPRPEQGVFCSRTCFLVCLFVCVCVCLFVCSFVYPFVVAFKVVYYS